MWGNAQAALELDTEHPLADLLFQTTGPASIPLHDSRWQQLLLQYEILVHLDPESNTLIQTACHAMARHAVSSSNLAALALHVSRMLNDLRRSVIAMHNAKNYSPPLSSSSSYPGDAPLNPVSGRTPIKTVSNANVNANSNAEAELMGKVRATCGVLNLFRILAHATISSCCSQAVTTAPTQIPSPSSNGGIQVDGQTDNKKVSQSPSPSAAIAESFMYRENVPMEMKRPYGPRDTAIELLYALIPFISMTDPPPELYDATVLALSLLLVLLSTQLYQPMTSSLQIRQNQNISIFKNPLKNVSNYGCNFFLDKIMSEAYKQYHDIPSRSQSNPHLANMLELSNNNLNSSSNPESLANFDWAHSITQTILNWIIKRPVSPPNTIASDYSKLVESLVDARGEKPGPDGMYETHVIVHAHATMAQTNYSNQITSTDQDALKSSTSSSLASTSKRGINRVISVSSQILLLPFRLVRLAISTIGLVGNHSTDHLKKIKVGELTTNHVIWLSDSPIADLGSSILLLLTNNYRSNAKEELLPNPFCMELKSLKDNRWDRSDLLSSPISPHQNPSPQFSSPPQVRNGIHSLDEHSPEGLQIPETSKAPIAINFESLFESFGATLHNEMGSLLLYTLLQSSSSFSASVAARSDLDKLVMPLLRTLYYSSALNPIPSGQNIKKAPTTVSVDLNQSSNNNSTITQKPYRSQSQLYVVLILLLLFSQDLSFGPDAFRRVVIPSVSWYRERKLRSISLGSIMLLTVLRSMTYNLSRLNDGFLISNCCAVLLNLSPHVENLHSYAAMRLASVTIFCCKRYSILLKQNEENGRNEEMSTILGMYREAAQTLLQVLKHCLRKEVIKKNLDVLYALVYMYAQFKEAIATEPSPFKKSDTDGIHSLIAEATSIINDIPGSVSAARAMEVLSGSIQTLLSHSSDPSNSNEEIVFDDRSLKTELEPDFSFTYEEEADPEVFFVPYLWEVIVCVITSGSLEWSSSHIQISPSMIVASEEEKTLSTEHDSSFSNDVLDVV